MNEFIYTVYKTTNLINNKIYIGYHKTSNINDNYLGSGKILLKAIKKYGRVNFKKEVLFTFITEQEAYNKETELVNEEFIKRDDTYNTVLGGKRGKIEFFGEENGFYGKEHSKETKEKIRNSLLGNIPWNKYKTDVYSKETKEKWSKARLGKKLSDEHKSNIAKSQLGKKNSKETIEKRRLSKLGKHHDTTSKNLSKYFEFFYYLILHT